MTQFCHRHGTRAMRALLLVGLSAAAAQALAHHPVAQCRQVEGGQVQCIGGFSDGSGAPGVTLDVISYDERILVHGKLGADSTLRFKKPSGEFYVLFDPGPGHVVEIDHSDIDP